MKTIKTLTSILAVLVSCMMVCGQERTQNMPPQHMERPSSFELVDEVRNSIGLDSKEFDKMFSAYEKYNKSVFGNVMNNRPAGPRGSHPGMSGGPGRHGGNPGFGGSMGRPRGEFNGHGGPENLSNREKKVDFEKLEKNKTKAEEKLCKSIRKIFKNNPEKYESWLEIRQAQLKRIFPARPLNEK